MTVVMKACEIGDLYLVDFLIGKGAEVNSTDKVSLLPNKWKMKEMSR